MSKNCPFDTHIVEHFSAGLSSESSVLVLGNVLRADFDVVLYGMGRELKVDLSWCNDDLDLAGIELKLVKNLFGETLYEIK